MTEYICKIAKTNSRVEVKPIEVLVRCKDCMHRKEDHRCYERKHIDFGLYVGGDSYCAWATRREE